MMILSVRHFFSLILLFFLVTFDKTLGMPFLSLFVLSLIAQDWPGVARIALLAVTAILISGLFLLPAWLTLLSLAVIVYGWIFATQAQTYANLVRVLWIGFWSIVYFVFSGAQVESPVFSTALIFNLIAMILSWRYLEKTNHGI